MTEHSFTQVCQECGEATYGQVAPALNNGETITLYCGECGEETEHKVWD